VRITSLLVVCVGNICRSPLGERMLRAALDARGADIAVSSAGLHALVGHRADSVASAVAKAHGLSLQGHRARQFTETLGRGHDMILVMEPRHKDAITHLSPALTGKTFLFDHWTAAKGIADPYRRSRDVHEIVFGQVLAAATAWADALVRARSG
jgi:protein-tyrosine phosphatase